MREYDGWTTRRMTTQGGVQAGAYWEGPGRRLLYIDGCAGSTRQDTGAYAVVELSITEDKMKGLDILKIIFLIVAIVMTYKNVYERFFT